MSDDKWAEAWSRLTNAVEAAYEAGMSEEEILDVVNDNNPKVVAAEEKTAARNRQLKPKKVKP